MNEPVLQSIQGRAVIRRWKGLPGGQEDVGQVEESCSVLHMEYRWVQQVVQLLIKLRIISVL